MKILVEKLKSYKLKVTPQRLAIFEILASTDKHPSAETIHKSLSESLPSMSLATVYKTLDAFKRIGLVQEINVGEDSFRYDANNKPHPHIICTKCHEVHDLPNFTSLDALRDEVQSYTDFDVLQEQIYFYGECGGCRLPDVQKNVGI